KDWVSNYDSLLTLWEFFRCATQIDKDSYQVLSSKNETVKAMDKFLISFSLKDNGAEYTMTLRGSGFEYEEIPITINEYNSFMDFKNREFPLEQNRRLYAWDILQKKQSDIPKRIKGYIHQAIGDVSLGYALLEDIVSKLKRGKFELQIPGGGIKECDGWYIYEKIIDDNFAIVIESLGFALKIYGGDERFRNGSSVVLEDEDYSLIYNFLVNAGCQQVELAEQVDAIVSANLAVDSDITEEEICEKYKSTIEAFKKEQLAL
ncbi:TPA: protein YtfI, partial [Shigella flexneri]